jgi:hypothetical protein
MRAPTACNRTNKQARKEIKKEKKERKKERKSLCLTYSLISPGKLMDPVVVDTASMSSEKPSPIILLRPSLNVPPLLYLQPHAPVSVDVSTYSHECSPHVAVSVDVSTHEHSQQRIKGATIKIEIG